MDIKIIGHVSKSRTFVAILRKMIFVQDNFLSKAKMHLKASFKS